MAEPSQPGSMVPAEQVSAITHLSLAEVKDLTRQGHLPKPQRGLYNLSQCLAGAFRWYDETRKGPVMVHVQELSHLSGLGESMLRKLAGRGYFPPPRKSYYDLKATFAGLIKYQREHLQRRDQTLGQKRERKLDNDITLQEIEIEQKNQELIPVLEMVDRLTPAVTAMRQCILSSTLSEEERDELIEALGRILDNAIKQPVSASCPAPAADPDQTAAPDGQPVGG